MLARVLYKRGTQEEPQFKAELYTMKERQDLADTRGIASEPIEARNVRARKRFASRLQCLLHTLVSVEPLEQRRALLASPV